MLHLRRKAYGKKNTSCEWGDGGKIGNKNIFFSCLILHNFVQRRACQFCFLNYNVILLFIQSLQLKLNDVINYLILYRI